MGCPRLSKLTCCESVTLLLIIIYFQLFRYFKVVNIPYMVGHSYNSDDIIYNTLPLYHTSGGGIGVGACLVNGNTVALRRKFSASRFWDDCIKTKATVCDSSLKTLFVVNNIAPKVVAFSHLV